MGKIIDVDKVQEALSRAAHNAKYGSRDVRAGRFVAGAASAELPKRGQKPRSIQLSSRNSRSEYLGPKGNKDDG